ncbi:MAG: hypothetical protein HUU28_11525 [Planctomycetaceae bacterium]|jgi:tetratricopeptide (TPR) repeat protein|nr:hypothetical protein [Planctomycetaceae bacterium]
MDRSQRFARIAGAALLLLAPAWADRLVTTDNRVLVCRKARAEGDGYKLEFENGTIVLADKSLVKAVEIEGDMSDYVPANEDERKKLEQGYVKYKSKWMSKPAYEDELRKEAEAARKRTDEIALHSQWNSAWTSESKHFLFTSNTSPELLGHYSELLEAYYALMDERFGIKMSPVLGRTKMKVHIFKSKKEFQNIAEAGYSTLGYFDRSSQELRFFHNYAEPAQTEWVSLHECTHLLTYLIEPQYYPQIWLNEAVADYFGSCEISRDKKGKVVLKPGTLQNDRVLTVQNAIKDGNDTKLDELFLIPREGFDGFQYAHAWSFIYFLNEANPKYKKAFDKFFKDLYTQAKSITYESIPVPSEFDKSGVAKQASPKEIRRVVLSALGHKDTTELEKEWKSFIAAIPLDSPEQRFKRAYIQVAYRGLWGKDREETRKNAEQALADLNAAIEGGIQTARAYATRAEVLQQLDKDSEAEADLRAAIKLDPLSARYRWELGTQLYPGFAGFADEDGFSFSVEVSNQKPPEGEAKEQLGLAAELDPETYGELFGKLHK